MRPSATKWKRRSGFEERPQLSMPAPSKSPSSEWDTGLLRGQIGLAQQDLAQVRNNLTTALALGDRLKASVAAERKASARSNQHYANDERLSQSLCQRQ